MNIARAAVAAALLMACQALAQNAEATKPADWKPVEGRLMTRWAKDVKPDAPLPEYPRPTMVRDKWMNLNGLWEYMLIPRRGDATPQVNGTILVPFAPESPLSGVGRHPAAGQKLVYTRDFTLPDDWNENVLLHFGAVNWEFRVFVNGHPVGAHSGGYDPFTSDITKTLKPGVNKILVEVMNPGNAGGQPRGKQFDTSHAIWYTASSGIWQTVWLEPVPTAAHIKSIRYTPNAAEGWIDVTASVEGLAQREGVLIEIIEGGKVVSSGLFPDGQAAHLLIPDPHFWSPDDPFLYEVSVRVKQRHTILDSVHSYCALRDISLGKDERGLPRLLLNGKPVFQYGPLDQGYWPDGLYTAPTDEALKSDIVAAKKMGCNMIRKHVKVEPERWYTWCDKLGVLVWQDMPSPFFKTKDFDEGFPEINEKWKANFEKELAAMIAARRNHPCIVMWVPFNEGWGQQDMEWAKRVAESVKQQDPTRLVNNATGWSDMGVGDTRDIHNYPEPALPPIETKRAAVLGEFGGLGLPLEGHTWVNKDNWGYRTYKTTEEVTDAYVAMMEQMPALIAQGLSAAVYTQTTDVEIECNGWLTYDREVWKIDPDKARPATMKMYGKAPTLKTIVPDATGGINGAVAWYYTTDNKDADWFKRENKASWLQGMAGFGSPGTPAPNIGTNWISGDIWIRRSFQFDAVPKNPHLHIYHDEDAEVYINGTLALSLKGYTTSYQLVRLTKKAAALLKQGENFIAIHCHQTTGGQYIDCGFVDVLPSE